MSHARGAGLAALAWVLGGCVIDASLEGKRCPCADGYTCDTLRDVCVRNACDPSVRVEEFSPSWATAHDIRWTWEPSGPEDRFLRYELWVAESTDDLASRSGTARMFGPEENPELGGYRIRVASDVVTSTVTRGLAAGAAHSAQLLAVDVSGCAFPSEVVTRATVPEPQNAITLFDDVLLPGAETAPAPPVLAVTSEGGDEHLRYDTLADDECNPEDVTDLEDVRATCGQPLRVRGFSVDVSEDPDNPVLARLNVGTFVYAYLELSVRIESLTPSYFSSVWLANGSCLPFEAPDHIYRFDGLTLPNSAEAVRVEIPLTALVGIDEQDQDQPFTYASIDTAQTGTPLCGFALGGTWHKAGVVRIDDVRIRF